MLSELRIRNLAIIDRLDLTFGPGFNVLTGETGAGKSIIIDAVGLLLGDRAAQEMVRAGADRTEVEGVFLLGPGAAGRVGPLLAENGLEGDQPDLLLVAREVRSNGRSVARVNGRAVTTALVGEICQQLVDIHGQGEHLSLLREREHLGLLDRYAALDHKRALDSEHDSADQPSQMAALVSRLRQVRRDLESLRQDQRERARRIDLLSYQVEEIEAAQLQPGEDDVLEAERRRLGNAEQLAALTTEALQIIQEGSPEQPAALDGLGTAEASLARLARIDPDTRALADQLAQAAELLADVGRQLGRYREQVEFNPRRLEQAEERLQLIRSLERKYSDGAPGGGIAGVLAYGRKAAADLQTITHAEEHIAELESLETHLLGEIGRLGAGISVRRRAAGERLARAIERELADLQMARARCAVDIRWTADPAGAVVEAGDAPAGQAAGRYAFDTHGLDQVAFLVSANPGEPLRPLARVASGGETSRLMLALKAVLGHADETPTLIFDEIDAGIGGRVGATVGRKLWGLTAGDESGAPVHQVLCITHLPQLAAYGDVHYHVAKQTSGERTTTGVRTLAGDERITELALMLGADSQAGRASVAEMMAEVADIKSRRAAEPEERE